MAESTASDGAAGDEFGASVAISGNTVVVGALQATIGSNPYQGAAYVFHISGGAATQVAKLTASDGAAWNEFGSSVAIDGDTIVVGASAAWIGSSENQGAAYVFVAPPGGWTDMNETAKLVASDGASFDLLGSSVGVSGNTVVVGAPGNPYNSATSTAGPGAAYVFTAPSGGWSGAASNPMYETAKLAASDGAGGDNFGLATAIDGSTIVAGASSATVGSNPQQGAAYVYVEPAGGWAGTAASPASETAKLVASDGNGWEIFGFAVGLAGNTVAVGAPWATVGSEFGEGAAYVFVEPSGSWSGTINETAKLTASDGAMEDHVGSSVSISPGAIVLGAPFTPYNSGSSTAGPGVGYLFVESADGWSGTAYSPVTETQKLAASDGAAGDEFGISVGISGETVVAGAPYAHYNSSSGTPGTGIAYIFGAMPQISFAAAPNPANYGTTVTLTATVAEPYSSMPVPSGAVTFQNGAASLGPAVELDSNGVARLQTSALPLGVDILTANYGGDTNYLAVSATYSETIGQAPQTINFTNPGTQTVGTTLALSATATSGLAVSFTSETNSVCTVSGATASFIATGTCTIQAAQAGNSAYAAASPVTQSFAVTGDLQTIAFANPGEQSLGTPLTLSASASSGLAISFSSQTTSVCTVSGATATFVAWGTCAIQATQAGNTDWAAATAEQSFAVGTFAEGSGGSTSLSISPGTATSATGTVNVAGINGFRGAVKLTCAITPSAAEPPACSLNPATVTFVNGATSESSTLTITTTASAGAEKRKSNLLRQSAGFTTLALLLFFTVPRPRKNLFALMGWIAVAFSIGAAGCSAAIKGTADSGSGNSYGTTAGSYTITVTGTSGTYSATVGTIALAVK